jgi:2-polyprenyl-3-methyl-5-hydroxy-6-metoxy-1,4-benzoquinol methylase
VPQNQQIATFYAEHVHSHIHADHQQTLQKYRRRIQAELERFGIPIDQLQDKTILDIGSGWQAIVFQELGCLQVYHLDINRKHVEFLNHYINEHRIDNIKSEQADISRSLGFAKHIDLAFVAGVYHHLQDREGFIKNLLPNMTANGDILFRVYRSGTWSRWLVSALRMATVDRLTPVQLLGAYRLLHPYGLDNQFAGDMIDDLLTPQWLAFHPREFIADAEQLKLQCQCLAEPFAIDFSSQDENFRVKWHVTDSPHLIACNQPLATGKAHVADESDATPEITDLRRQLIVLLESLNNHADRDAALVVVSLYFLVRKHAGIDAFNGQISHAAENPDLAAWRIERLKESLTHFRDWLTQ